MGDQLFRSKGVWKSFSSQADGIRCLPVFICDRKHRILLQTLMSLLWTNAEMNMKNSATLWQNLRQKKINVYSFLKSTSQWACPHLFSCRRWVLWESVQLSGCFKLPELDQRQRAVLHDTPCKRLQKAHKSLPWTSALRHPGCGKCSKLLLFSWIITKKREVFSQIKSGEIGVRGSRCCSLLILSICACVIYEVNTTLASLKRYHFREQMCSLILSKYLHKMAEWCSFIKYFL